MKYTSKGMQRPEQADSGLKTRMWYRFWGERVHINDSYFGFGNKNKLSYAITMLHVLIQSHTILTRAIFLD